MAIKLYGALARKLKAKYPGIDPKNIPCKVKSAGEAVRAMESQFPGFKSFIRRKGYYKVVRGQDVMDDSKSLSEEQMKMNFSDDTWHFMPVAAGLGKAGMLQTILGAVILVIGIVIFIYTDYPGVMLLGGAMMLGGIVTMLTPVPAIPKNEGNEDTPSYLFNGSLNVNQPGVTIPLAYGETFIGSIVSSFGVKVEAYA
jgi:predicted phage tail protein